MHLNKKDKRFWSHVLDLPFNTEEDWVVKLEQAKTRIQQKKEKRADKINRHNKITEFNVNELVLLKTAPISSAIAGETKSLCLIYEGPYKIHHKIGKSTYMLTNISDTTILKGPYHIQHLKKYFQ